MNVLLSVLKIAGAVLSTYGYFRFLKSKTCIPAEFCPVIVLSTIGVIVFVSGILNLMLACFWLVFLTGFALLLSEFRRTAKECGTGAVRCYAKDLTPGIIVFIILSGYLFLWLSKEKYYHYDNFSFWGLAVKLLCYENEFPKFDNPILEFTSYPLGCASLIWYFCKIIGYTEGHVLFIQSVYILSCALPVFAFTDKRTKLRYVLTTIVALITVLFLITCGKDKGNGIYTLSVDVMLAAVAFSAYAIVMYCRNRIKTAAVLTVPLLSFEICVKNSGIFWIFVISTLLFYCAKGKNKREKAVFAGSNVMIPLCIRIIWDAHVRYVFAKYETGNHAVSLSYYHRMLSEKSVEDIQQISKSFFSAVFSKDNAFWILLIVLCMFALILYIVNRNAFHQSKPVFTGLFLIIIYLCYQLSSYFVYLFSMPVTEAKNLASFSRYSMTVEVFIWGVIIINILQTFQSDDWNPVGKNRFVFQFLLMTLCISVLTLESGSVGSLIQKRNLTYMEKARDRLDAIQTEYGLYEGSEKYLVYISARDGEFRKFMSKFVLYAPVLQTVTAEQLTDMTLDEMNEYDRFIILEQDETINEWMEEYGISDTRCIDLPLVN